MTTPAASILIVDDEAPNRKLLETLLRPEGHVTRTAASGEEALASVSREPPDLILLDVMMPGMDGYQVARALKANPATAHIPVIMVTASVGRDARLTGLNAGAEDFLNKPVDRGELWLRVRNLLRLKSLSDFQKNHNVILEEQVRQRTAELQNYRSAMDATVDTILMVNRGSMRIVHANAAAASMLGYTGAELLQLSPVQLGTATPEELAAEYDAVIAGKNSDQLTEIRLRRKDGSELQAEVRRHAHRSGPDWIVVAIARDITERKKAEARIKRMNRVYAVLSGINTLIVRVRERDELFRDACRIAVEGGGFLLAWVGLVDRDARMLAPVASAGTAPDPLALIRERFALGIDAPLGNTFSARAIREKRIVVSNDVQNDPLVLHKEEHAQRGSRSMAMLPLEVAGEAAGILALYSSEAGFFDDEELTLLAELAGDIAFAIDNIAKQEQFDYLAYYDALTGLANRTLFLERVAQHMRRAESAGHKLAVFLVDLERFKGINDSLGQAGGDALLRQVADWLTRDGGDASLVARFGADHFALVLPEVRDMSGVARLIDRTLATFLEHPFRLGDAVFRVSAKIGAAVFPEDGANADVLLKHAEAALKNAKASGEKFLFYTQTMTDRVAAKLTLENQLRRAFDNGEFVLHYQPKVSLATGRLTSVEALIRWNDPQTGLVPPAQFIPLLEETGLIHEVGLWALREAISTYLRWHSAGLPAVRVAVNVSPMQLRNHAFFADIAQLLGVDARAAAGLELEITESLIMEDVQHNIASLEAIRATGVTIAIDDFGTGFSSLSYLAKLPVDTLKIDRFFVNDMMAGPAGLALVSTIIDLAHSLRLKVVAEGVETEEQSRLLRLLKCDEMQGFLFSKPLPADQLEAKFLVSLAPAAAA